VAYDSNLIVKDEGLLNVTGSQIHWKIGDITHAINYDYCASAPIE